MGIEDRRLTQSRLRLVVVDLELQPDAPWALHLGREPQEPILFEGLHPPEIERVSDRQPNRIPAPAAEEFPDGIVAPIDPGPREEEELVAVIGRLLDDAGLREEMGRLARGHVRAHHGLDETARRLAAFLEEVAARKEPLRDEILAERADEGGLLGFLMEEVRWGARDLGLSRVPLGLEGLLGVLAPSRPRP